MKHQSTNSEHHHSGHDHTHLIQLLNACVAACEKCSAACLEEEDVNMMTHCIELDRDCADICALASRLLLRDSEVAHTFLAICEEA